MSLRYKATEARYYQTSPSRQSHIKSAEVSRLIPTGNTNTVPSSSGVRVGPVGASTDVGPRQGNQPRDANRPLARSEELSGPELVGAAHHLLDAVEQRVHQPLATAVLPYRDPLDVTAAQRATPVDQSPLDHRRVRDDRAVTPDQRVHPAQRMLPVGVGEVTGECFGDHLAHARTGVAVEIGGVDQAGGVYLGAHPICLHPVSQVRSFSRKRRAGPCPVQPHVLTGPHLGDLVDVLVDHDAHDRVAAGDRVIGPQDDR